MSGARTVRLTHSRSPPARGDAAGGRSGGNHVVPRSEGAGLSEEQLMGTGCWRRGECGVACGARGWRVGARGAVSDWVLLPGRLVLLSFPLPPA